MEGLTNRQRTILRSLLEKLSGADANLLNDVLNGQLAINDIQRVCEIINDEYLLTGIERDYSPNQYGRELQKLLDMVNAPRLS